MSEGCIEEDPEETAVAVDPMFAAPSVLINYMRTWFAQHPQKNGQVQEYGDDDLGRFLGYYFVNEAAFHNLNAALENQWGSQMDINALKKPSMAAAAAAQQLAIRHPLCPPS